jgi:hypothetical protein
MVVDKPSKNEFLRALFALKRIKARRIDNITSKMIAYTGETLHSISFELVRMIWRAENRKHAKIGAQLC